MSEKDLLQEDADSIRVLRSALRTHDPEAVDTAHARIRERLGKNLAGQVVIGSIERLIVEEGWSFLMKTEIHLRFSITIYRNNLFPEESFFLLNKKGFNCL